MDTIIYLDLNGKEVFRKGMEGKGRRPSEKDTSGNYIRRLKEHEMLENGKVVPNPNFVKKSAPEAVKQEIKAPEKDPTEEIDKYNKEHPKTIEDTIINKAFINHLTNGTPKEEAIKEAIETVSNTKLVIYLNSQGQELLRKPKGGRGRSPKEINKDGNFVVHIKDEVLDKFIKEHNLQNVAPVTVLSKKDSEVFINKVLNENAAPDEALKEAFEKAKEQKIETPEDAAPNTESEKPEEYEVSERRRKKLTIEPVYTVEEIVNNLNYRDTEMTTDPNGNVTIMNGMISRQGIPDLIEVLPYNSVFAKIELNVQENSIKAWANPSDNKGNFFAAPSRECYGCLKL